MGENRFMYTSLDIKFNDKVRLLQNIKVENFALRKVNRVYKLIPKGTVAHVLSYKKSIDSNVLNQVPLLNIRLVDGDISIDDVPEWLVEKVEDGK
jgi:hypothetical protein